MGEINCNSEIYWDFTIWSECGPINEVDINNILNISKQNAQLGEIKTGRNKKDEYYWKCITPTINGIEPEVAIKPLLDTIEENIDQFSVYLQTNNLYLKFCNVIFYHSGYVPCLVISKQFINICHRINATIEQDIYSDYTQDESFTIEI